MNTRTGSTSEDADRQAVGEEGDEGLANAVNAVLAATQAKPLAPGLYLVATPIGNLADISLRALSCLAGADVIYCEDTRQSRKLVSHYAIRTPLRSYHEHNADRVRGQVLRDLADGRRVALISDAGTPLVSDPGHKLVREARAAGAMVSAIPGPSAVLAAVTASGLAVDRFWFEGFLPARSGPRDARLGELAGIPAALVVFEAPGRLAVTLDAMERGLGERRATVARELTKRYETHHTGTLGELAAEFDETPARGEAVIVVDPPAGGSGGVSDDEIRSALDKLTGSVSLRDAARDLADHFGVPRKRVYALGLATAGARPERDGDG